MTIAHQALLVTQNRVAVMTTLKPQRLRMDRPLIKRREPQSQIVETRVRSRSERRRNRHLLMSAGAHGFN